MEARHELTFRHETIDDEPPCGRLGICQPTDLTGNGRPDVIVGGMGAERLAILGREVRRGHPILGRLLKRLREEHVFWYENPGWERHTISTTPNLKVFGNTLADLTGDGRPGLLTADGYGGRNVCWFESPENPREPWTRHLLFDDFEMYHDIAFGDVDNDGAPELVGLSQQSEVVFYYDVPSDPTQTPWPAEHLHVVDDDANVEGIAIVDIDGDGRNELIAGTAIYHQPAGSDEWERDPIVTDWDWTRVAVADLDGDGRNEVVFAEGDSPHLGSHPGRVAWFDPPDWEAHVLRDDMFCPHSLQIADFTGDGRQDIYVGEMGLGENTDPEHVIFVNEGDGHFEERVLCRGVETHEARAVDMTGNGRPDIVGKSYEPDTHVDVWYNES
jgi:hypothetical protein